MGRKPGAKKLRDREEIEAEIAALSQELERIDSAERARLGRIAFAVVLGNLSVSDADLEAAFRHLAATFSAKETKPKAPALEKAAGPQAGETVA
jgi:glutathione S-transferase